MTDALRYPIGRFEAPAHVSPEQIEEWIDEIEDLPSELRALIAPWSDAQLAMPYRPDGWTVAQVVHHLADSHMNSMVRFRWALTEERPTIKDYREAAWAELPDVSPDTIGLSLDLLDTLHARWCELLRALGPAELAREFVHPESGPVRLDVNIGIYAWHGRHHLAHLEALAVREGWVLTPTARERLAARPA